MISDGLQRERARDAKPLALAAGEFERELGQRLVAQADARKQRCCPLATFAA